MLVYCERKRLGWLTVFRSSVRKCSVIDFSAVVELKEDKDAPTATTRTECSTITSPSTSLSSTDRRFSTASKKAKRKKNARKKLKEAHDRAVMRRRRAREARESNSTAVQEIDRPSSHKGWSADFGLCPGTAIPSPSRVRDNPSVCHHKGMSLETRCYLYTPNHPSSPLEKGRLPTRFVAGRRLKSGKYLKEMCHGRTRSYPKRLRRLERKVARRRRQEQLDVQGVKVEDVPMSEDEELALLLSPERNLRPSDGLFLEPVTDIQTPERIARPADASESAVPSSTSAPVLNRTVRLVGGSRDDSVVNGRPIFGLGTDSPITCPNVTGLSCFASSALLLLRPAVSYILRNVDVFELDEVHEKFHERVNAMHEPFMEFVAAMYENLQNEDAMTSILNELYEASGLEATSDDAAEFWHLFIMPLLRAKKVSHLFDQAATHIWTGNESEGQFGLLNENITPNASHHSGFIKVEVHDTMQEAVSTAVCAEREYTPRELYDIAENKINEAERSGKNKLSDEQKANIKAQYIRKGNEHVYLREQTPFILFNISRVQNGDSTGLDRRMVLDQEITMSVALDDDGNSTVERNFKLATVVLYRGRNNRASDHYFVLNEYETGVYMQDDARLFGPKSWDDWKELTSDKIKDTCSYMALYVRKTLESCPVEEDGPALKETASKLLSKYTTDSMADRLQQASKRIRRVRKKKFNVNRSSIDRRTENARSNLRRTQEQIEQSNAGRTQEQIQKSNALSNPKRTQAQIEQSNAGRSPLARRTENARYYEKRKRAILLKMRKYYRDNRSLMIQKSARYYNENKVRINARRIAKKKETERSNESMRANFSLGKNVLPIDDLPPGLGGSEVQCCTFADAEREVDTAVRQLRDNSGGCGCGDSCELKELQEKPREELTEIERNRFRELVVKGLGGCEGQRCTFADAEREVETAVMQLHFNSGRHRNRDALELKKLQGTEWKKLTLAERNRFRELVAKLEDQISGECVNPASQKEALGKFFKRQGLGLSWGGWSGESAEGSKDMPFYCCASCGVQYAGDADPYERKTLDELQFLEYDEEEQVWMEEKMNDERFDAAVIPCDGKGGTRTVQFWKAYNFFPLAKDAGRYFHLYPQFVEHNFEGYEDDEELEELDDLLDTILPDTSHDGVDPDVFGRLQEKYIRMNDDSGTDSALFCPYRGRLQFDFPDASKNSPLLYIGDEDAALSNRNRSDAEAIIRRGLYRRDSIRVREGPSLTGTATHDWPSPPAGMAAPNSPSSPLDDYMRRTSHPPRVEFCESELAQLAATMPEKFSAMLCHNCAKCCGNDTVPKYSLKNGVDFGDPDRIHLEDLNAIEKHIISPVRLYAQVIKMEGAKEQSKGAAQRSDGGRPSQYTLRGSVICFKHESTAVCSDLLSVENMKRDLQLQFVGPDGGWDWMYNRCYGKDPARLVGEAYKIYAWLKFLKLVHPAYEDMPDLPAVEEISARLATLAEELMEESFKTLDDVRLKESMKARDDIARVRNAMSDDEDGRPAEEAEGGNARGEQPDGRGEAEDGEEADDQEEVEAGPAGTPMRYVLMTGQGDTANQNPGDSVHETLRSVAELFGTDVNEAARDYRRTAAGERADSVVGRTDRDDDERILANEDQYNCDIIDEEDNVVRRDSNPINEFTDGECARIYPFPTVSLFGRMYGKVKGPLTESQCRHCLLHCGKRFARERLFLFSEFDKRQRHQNSLGVHLKMNASKKEFRTLAETFRKRGFQRDIKDAVRNPTGPGAKRILRKIGPLLKQSGKKTPLGTFERHDAMGEILAMGREYGSPTCMMTFAMDDANSANVMRLSLRSTNNVDFPSLAPETALERLKHGRLICEGNVDCSYAGLAKLANENPVAVALEYKKILINVMATLVGIKPEKISTKSFYRGWSNRGVVVGSARAFIGVTETQARGGLHFHVIIWGGLSPELLECAATVPELFDAVSKVLESQFRTSLPREMHVFDLVKKNKGVNCRGGLKDKNTLSKLSSLNSLLLRKSTKRKRTSTNPCLFPKFNYGTGFLKRHSSEVPRALLRPPDPDECRCRFVNFANITASVFNMHRHCFTCHKGQAGKTGCRLNMPRTKHARTAYVQIVPRTEPEDFDEAQDDTGEENDVSYRVLKEVQPLHEVELDPKDSLWPFRDLDPRVIAINQKRSLLRELPELLEKDDDERAKEEILNNLKEAMGYRISLLHGRGKLKNKENALFRGQPPERIPPDDVTFTEDESRGSRDPNCLYSAMQHLLFLSGVKVPSVGVLRKVTLDYLVENRDRVVPGHGPECSSGRSLASIVEEDAGMTVEEYRQVKGEANPRSKSCCWGEAIDVKLFAMRFNVNVAVYRAEEGPDGGGLDSSASYRLDRTLSCIVNGDESAVTVRLVCRQGLNGDAPPGREEEVDSERHDMDTEVENEDLPLYFLPLVPTELLDTGNFFHMDRRLIDLLIAEIRPASLEQLRDLYDSVSSKLVGRNGYVAEFNEVVSAALGVNTNCLFLGSREQSKSAVFYLGPYICKDLVKITDAFDLMLEAIDHANKYDSQAANPKDDERFTQRILTRVLNKLNSMVEISDTQVAATLLGLQSGLCSDIFSGLDATRYMKFIANQKTGGLLEVDDDTDDERSEDNPEEDDGSMANFIAGEDEGDDDDQEQLSDEAAFDLEEAAEENRVLDIVAAEEGHPCSREGPPPDDEADSDDESEDANDRFDCPFELKAERCPFGPGNVYMDNEEQYHSVTFPEMYFNRGKALEELTLDEYLRVISCRKKPKECKGPGKRGRKCNTKFPFPEKFPLHNSHDQVLKSKHCTLKFFKSPPRHPGPEPSKCEEKKHKKWLKEANNYGFYYLTLFRPEIGNCGEEGEGENRKGYDWKTFVEYVQKLGVSIRQIDRLRLERMECVAHSWKSKFQNRKMLADFRGRDRDLWNKREREDYIKSVRQQEEDEKKRFDGVFPEHENEDEVEMLSLSRQLSIMMTVNFSDQVNLGLDGFHRNLSPRTGQPRRPAGPQGPTVSIAESKPEMARELKTAKRRRDEDEDDEEGSRQGSGHDELDMMSLSEDEDEWGEEVDSDVDEHDFFPSQEHHARGGRRPQHLDRDVLLRKSTEDADRYLKTRSLSKDQEGVVQAMRTHFVALKDGSEKEDNYEAPILLVTGGPGVGKSYVVHTLAGLAKEMDVGDQVRMAYIGIAAVGIDGYSACSLMDIPTDFDKESREKARGWNMDRLTQFNQKFNPKRISCVVFDEISTVKPEVLGYLNLRLQEATQCNKPFGGLAMIMLGDFDQMKPVGAPCTIPSTIMTREVGRRKKARNIFAHGSKHQVTKVGGNGLEVFKKARHMRLTEQHRSLDREHTELLEKMSGGHQLTSDDLDNYKLLGEGRDGDADFRFATVLTAGNRERHVLNFAQAKRFAKENGTHVIRWQRKISSWRGKPRKEAQRSRAKQAEPCFWEYYVEGALGYINKNVNIDIRLANGTMMRYHSISPGSDEIEKYLLEETSRVPPGGVITLNKPPEIINVEVFPDLEGDDDNTKDLNRRLRREWTHGRIEDGDEGEDGDRRVIIPVAKDSSLKTKSEPVRGAGTAGRGTKYHPSSVSLQDHFPLELGFAMTVHKAQGRTIRRLILSLSCHPCGTLRLSWEALYVALSRVRRRDDIRILLKQGMDRKDLDYVSALKKDKYVGYYFGGFRYEDDGSPPRWDRDLALTAMDEAEARRKRADERPYNDGA